MNPNNDIRIRLASVEDVALIHDLLLELAATLGKSDKIKGTAHDLERYGFCEQPHFEALLAFAGEEAVGLVIYFYEYSTWRGTPGVYVQDLYVARQLRGTGLGRKLLRVVREHASAWGGKYVKLAVHGHNPAAIAFYQHLGFELSDDEQVLFHSGR